MPTLVLLWVWVCAYLNCAGWALSALHQLNAAGYMVTLALGVIALVVWRKQTFPQMFPPVRWQKHFRRFRRPFPLAFLILSAMALLGGVLYAPTNYDALAYRLPRVLHWLAAERWHWIHSFLERINNRSCGIEWVSAPFLALLKSDRPLFLINTVSFLLLPGLIFSVFTRLGVRRRVAWHWMWIAPTGYCFLLQAGSIGNDLFGAPFALAAVDFALRAKVSRSPRHFFASVLAAAMMTSAKTASLPLLLPWAIALLPSLKLMLRWPLRTAAVCVIAVFASALPTVVLNITHSDNWAGVKLSHSGVARTMVLRTGASAVSLVTQNLVPPVFPLAGRWNAAVIKYIPERLESALRAVMNEAQAYNFSVAEMQMEEGAGLGFGVSALLLASVAAAGFARPKKYFSGDSTWQVCVRWAPLVSLLALMTQYNMSVIARIITPYYLLVLPALLVGPEQSWLVCRRWWRAAAFIVFLIAGGMLVISPARPLFPVQTLLEKMTAHGSPSKLQARVTEVYLVYAQRNDGFAPARALLPPGLKVLGMITYDDPETSLWRPFGSRRIKHVCPADTAADLKARGIEYILLREQAIGQWFHCPLDAWLKQVNAQVVWKIPLNLRASSGPLDWYLVKLN
jgi:hypothetical protein